MQAQPLRITETVLRDGHQSLLATRMKTEDMLPIAATLDKVGFHSLEMWGGATFDTCMRFLNEDPWERLRALRSVIKQTPLQMLLRGQNVVGYRNYADDVVEAFVTRARENGIDIFRIFDALNDTRNMETAMRAAKRVGAHVQATICYTVSPVHSIDGFVETCKTLADMGADSICIKDMAGLISPYAAYELVSKLKAILGVPVQLHSHCTSGMASMSYLKAAEAGVDVVDTAISVMALQTSQPPTESIVGALQGQQRDTGLDLLLLKEIAEFYREVRKKYCEHEGGLVGVDTDVFLYQVPGGMFSNLTSQLREQKALHRLPEVLAELPRVRADLGYPPLVTPTSQIVGVQAVYNVLMGKPYRFVSNEVKAYLRGQYGRPPGPVNEEVRKMVLKGADVIDGRPADVLEPELGKAAVELGDLALSEEDVLSGALFPQVAKEFLQKRAEGKAVDLRAMAESVLANDTQQDRLSLCR
ncbi:MAG: pyruvate/oxaloacetate carboxyltransferase [Chloroflexi bacterium]|nr:pyruvate/oxaloacetate carboxyltransferase [Chloroflexota bacterium]